MEKEGISRVTADGLYQVGDNVKVKYAFGNEVCEWKGFVYFILSPEDDVIVKIRISGVGYALITVRKHERERMELRHANTS